MPYPCVRLASQETKLMGRFNAKLKSKCKVLSWLSSSDFGKLCFLLRTKVEDELPVTSKLLKCYRACGLNWHHTMCPVKMSLVSCFDIVLFTAF